ncbi:hypothetical protein Tco_1047266 [Tanacetum coccineum]
MKKQWNGQAYKELLWRCASVTTVPYFDKAMQDLKDFNKECFEWLAKIPPHSWSRSHFSGRAKSDILLNNLCECSKVKIFDARMHAINTALETIREYLIEGMANNCTVAFNWGEDYEVKGSIPVHNPLASNYYNMSLNGVQVMVDKDLKFLQEPQTPPKHNTPVGRPRKNRRKSKGRKAEMVKDESCS